MKRGWLKPLCGALLAGLFAMSWAGGAFGECGDPGPFGLQPENPPPPWQGTCGDEVTEMVTDEGECPGGNGCDQNKHQHSYGPKHTLFAERECDGCEQHQYRYGDGKD